MQSGSFEALFFVDNETTAEAVQWRAVGPFFRAGNGALQANARYEFAGLRRQTHGALLVTGDRTVLRQDGKAYQLSPALSGSRAQATSSCRRALEGIDLDTLVTNLSSKPEPAIEATVIEGDLRLSALLAALHRLTDPSVCGALLESAGVSPSALSALEAEIESTFKKSEATFTIDKDHVLIGVSLGIWVESPAPKPEEIDGILTINLSRINESSAIRESPSAKAKDAAAQQATPGQQAAVAGWVGLVNAVVGALAAH